MDGSSRTAGSMVPFMQSAVFGISWARNILENAVQSEVPLRTLRKGHIRHGRQQMPCTIIQALLLRIAA